MPKPRPPKLSVVGKSLSIAYSLKVPGTAIDPNGRYALRATITVGGELRFTTTRRYPALTPGGAYQADSRLDAVRAGTAAASPESNPDAMVGATADQEPRSTANPKDTYWKLIEIDGEKVTMVEGQRRKCV